MNITNLLLATEVVCEEVNQSEKVAKCSDTVQTIFLGLVLRNMSF